MSAMQTNLVEAWGARLAQHGYSVTAQRLAVIKLLAQSQRVVSAEELLDLALDQDLHLGRATVYRTLELLVHCGVNRPTIHAMRGAWYVNWYTHHALRQKLLVYLRRAVLEKLHLVFRVSDGERHHAYLRSDLAMQPLAICEGCGDLQVIQSHLFEQLLAELYRRSNFAIHGHRLQLSGLCQACQP